MKYFEFLKKGDKVGVCAPSLGCGEIDYYKKRCENAVKNFNKNGIEIKFSEHTFGNNKGRSCDAKTRAKEFEEMTQKVDRLGVDMDTWMEFLERYYQIRGSGKKQRVRDLMEDLELPPTTAQILGDIIGYDIR
jgi:muramoyltetrapeptide carboxypeptidase LdcA involved in peptidoglycan recycling